MARNQKIKETILVFIDTLLVNFAYLIAMFFRFDNKIPELYIKNYLNQAFLITIIYILCFRLFRLYSSLWMYASIDEFVKGVKACLLGGAINLIYSLFSRRIPLSISLMAVMLVMIFVVGFRLSFRVGRRYRIKRSNRKQKIKTKSYDRVMVIGSGDAGSIIIREMKNSSEVSMFPVCVIDDDKNKIGKMVLGVPVVGDRFSIRKFAEDKNIDLILIAIPKLTGESKKELINICKNTGCKVKTMPGLYELMNGSISLTRIRDVDPDELLGRTPIILDKEGISDTISGKTVLVTGGGGSIGSELCRQISEYCPKQLLILDIYENGVYDLQNELKKNYSYLDFKIIIGSVCDKKMLNDLFEEYRPQIIFHAAAHKHVPLMEDNPSEAIKNNVFGTLNTAETADKFIAERFVLISTDKAVNPTNIMGATKRICEMIVQSIDKKSKTNFSVVRFGNVLGSNGSVVPLFKKQIEGGGPVTVTNKYVTRFFMTITEASQLVLQAGAFAKGGEIFILDMGKPVKVYDLAKDLIKLSGFEPDKDIKIQIIGLRPGEKLYEEVLTEEEGLNKTKHEKIFVGRSVFDNFYALKEKLGSLNIILEKGNKGVIVESVIGTVKELVPTFYNPLYEAAAANAMAGLDKEYEMRYKKISEQKIYLASPHMSGMERAFVKDAFDTNWLAPLGPNVDAFEKEIADYVHISEAAALTTGTAAIQMAIRSLGIGKGDLVFCSSLTFAASCNPIIYEEAIPVFIDSERESWNMSPKALQKAFDKCEKDEKLPKAVIIVNLYGQSADYGKLKPICDKYNVPIIEDAAESLGATYKDKYTGTIGEFGIFSFNGNKIITTSGGGMLVSDNESAIKKVRFSVTQARDNARYYQHSELGFNYRMSNVLAGIGRGQVKVLNTRIEQKKSIYDFYKKEFENIYDIEMMPKASFGKPNYWLSVMTIKEGSKVKPLDVMIALEKENIESRPVWKPMQLQPYYMNYDFYSNNDDGTSVSEDLFNRGVCLPSDTKMNRKEIERVAGIIKGLFD
ncbi:MAG: polysaccharide biosynthesis protein [Clostridiaceae bacterium]